MPVNALDQYHLTALPFDLGRYDVPRIGRNDEWNHLQQILANVRQSKSPVIAVLLGTYGAGKTFMLWKLSESLSSSKKTGVLSSGPIRLIDPEQRKDFTRSLVLRLFSRGLDLENQLVPILKKVSPTTVSVPAALAAKVQLLLALANEESAAVARRVLTGGKALRKEAEHAGIVDASEIRTGDDAISLLQALQIVLRAGGVEALAILVDEVEYADALPKAQRVAVLDSIKHIWDQEVDFFSKGANAAQLLIVLATTPSFWQQMKAQIQGEAARGQTGVGITPFFQRIKQSDVVELPAELGEAEARSLIVNRMTEVRQGQKSNNLIPFTDEYVDYVYRLSQGLPRRILEICGVVLDGAAQRKLKQIDSTQAKKILRELLISYEPITERA